MGWRIAQSGMDAVSIDDFCDASPKCRRPSVKGTCHVSTRPLKNKNRTTEMSSICKHSLNDIIVVQRALPR